MLQYPLRMRYNWKTLWGCVGQGRDCIDKCKFFTMVWNQLLSVGKCQTPNPWQANVKRSLGLISDITVIRDYLIVCASFSYLEWRSSIKLISHNGKPPKNDDLLRRGFTLAITWRDERWCDAVADSSLDI